jgi:hypothetical protein
LSVAQAAEAIAQIMTTARTAMHVDLEPERLVV